MSNKIQEVLIIDDDEINNYVCEKVVMQSATAAGAKSFKRAEEALNYIRKQALEDLNALPEVILLDINMPIMDGWEFMEKLKAMVPDILPKFPVVAILSSSVHEGDLVKANNHPHIQDYITKPLTIDAVKRVVHNHVLA